MADCMKKKRTPQQIGRASKAKGARFELQIAHWFQKMVIPMLVVLHSIVAKLVRQEMWKVWRDSI